MLRIAVGRLATPLHPTRLPAARTDVGQELPFIKVCFLANSTLVRTYVMDRGLKHLIGDYLGAVKTAVELLTEAGIPRPASDHAWASNGVPGTGALRDGATYRKHGYGCEVHLATGGVDFDFGRAGQIDGFDVWRLADFAGDRLAAFGFKSRDELDLIFNAEVGSGKMLSSGYILHYVAGAVEPGT